MLDGKKIWVVVLVEFENHEGKLPNIQKNGKLPNWRINP